MTDGVERARLRTYLTGAQAETSDLAGENWRKCGNILAETAEALRKGATKIRDGEGDEMLVLFRPEGCVINGFLHEYDQPEKAQVTRGLPEAFDSFLFEEPVASLGTTLCLWYTPAHGWQRGIVEN